MNVLFLIDACMMGLFGFAAVHHAFKWWFSREERILLVFAVLCGLYSVFSLAMLSRHRVTTVSEAQFVLDTAVTIGALGYCVTLQFYAQLGNHRNRTFRVVLTCVLVVFALLNQWVPIRGTVIDLRVLQLPGGSTVLPIRTPAGAYVALFYVACVLVDIFGLVVARALWKRDRPAALLIVLGVSGKLCATTVAVLVDFVHVGMPYVGSAPMGFFVLCMSLLLAREYSARRARAIVANRQFETVFEHAPIGMALLASDGQVLRVNHALCDMLGTSAEEMCTRRLQDLTRHDDGTPHALEPRLLAGELETVVETCFVRKDGERVWALLAVSVAADDHGRAARIVAQMQDITELHAHRDKLEDLVATRTRELHDAKDEAVRANEAKSGFLAHMSHEIRTPLGVVMLYTQILQRDQTLDDSQRRKVDIILSSGKHLTTLLNDVLEMSRIEAGRAELVEDRFDAWSILDDVERMFSVQSASEGIALAIERAADLPRLLHGDGGKAKQILINLVSNAVKFTRQGEIRIKASARVLSGEEILVTILVVDTGIGIAASDIERMFQPFEQLEPGVRAGGTGLGLAISLSHARLMRGDLTAESVSGVGTTFTFTFIAKRVASDAVAEARDAQPTLASVAKRCKVLVVDDLKQNRDLLAELLPHVTYDTRTAADGASALAIHADWYPDLVLMDLRMPEMDGLEAVRRLRAAGSKAAIGMLTASAVANDERDALAIGADFFMRKPYDDRELFARIARVLADRAG